MTISPLHSAHCATHRYGGGPCDCPAGQLLAAAKDVVAAPSYGDYCQQEIRELEAAIAACEAPPPAPEVTKDKATLAGEERKETAYWMKEAKRQMVRADDKRRLALRAEEKQREAEVKLAEVTGLMQLHRARVDSLLTLYQTAENELAESKAKEAAETRELFSGEFCEAVAFMNDPKTLEREIPYSMVRIVSVAREDCQPVNISSRVCKYGTRCCENPEHHETPGKGQ